MCEIYICTHIVDVKNEAVTEAHTKYATFPMSMKKMKD